MSELVSRASCPNTVRGARGYDSSAAPLHSTVASTQYSYAGNWTIEGNMFSLEIRREILNRRPNSSFFCITIWNRRSCSLSVCLPTDREKVLSLPPRTDEAWPCSRIPGPLRVRHTRQLVNPSGAVGAGEVNGMVIREAECQRSPERLQVPLIAMCPPHYPFHKLFAAALNKASSSLSEKSHPAAWEPLKITPHPEFPPDRSKCLVLRASKQNLFHSNLSGSDPLLSHCALISEAPQVLSSAQTLVGRGRFWQHFGLTESTESVRS